MALLARYLSVFLLLSATPALARPGGGGEDEAPSSSSSSRSGPAFATPGLKVTGFFGGAFPERSDINMLRLRVDGAVPLKTLAPRVRLQGVIAGGIMYGGEDHELNFNAGGNTYTTRTDVTAAEVDVFGAARFVFPIVSALSLYADAGFGMAMVRVSAEVTTTQPNVNDVSSSDTDGAALIRIGAGGSYHLDDEYELVLELIGQNYYLGSDIDGIYSFLFGVGLSM